MLHCPVSTLVRVLGCQPWLAPSASTFREPTASYIEARYSCRHLSRFASHCSYLEFIYVEEHLRYLIHIPRKRGSISNLQSFLNRAAWTQEIHDRATIDAFKREGYAAYAGCSDPRARLRLQDLSV